MKNKLLKFLALAFTCATVSAFGVACNLGGTPPLSSSSSYSSEEISSEESSSEEISSAEDSSSYSSEEESTSEEISSDSSISPEDEYNQTATKGLQYAFAPADDGVYAQVVGIGTATDRDIRIPTKVSGYPVIAIAKSAFYEYDKADGITSVVIPDNVQSIGVRAFESCQDLTSVTIGKGVTNIGNSAFAYCYNLTSISYAGTVSEWEEITIGYDVFSSYLTVYCTDGNWTADLEDCWDYYASSPSASSSDWYDSSDDYSEEESEEYSLEESSDWWYDSSYEEVSSEDSSGEDSSSIDYGAMTEEEYNAIATQGLEYTVDSFAEECIVTGIGTASGDIIIIPTKYNGYPVTSIRSNAFEYCYNLTSVVIPDSVQFIGSSAFAGCGNLQEMTLPFVGGSKDATSQSSSSLFGYIFGTSSYTGATETFYYDSESGWHKTYYIPTTLKKITITGGNILYRAFNNCTNLTSVVIGDSVESIGIYAFDGCDNLTSVEIDAQSISYDAFRYCSNLTSVVIGDSVQSIGSSAFEFCDSLTNIEVDENNPYYQSTDGNLYSKDGKTLIQYAIGNTATSFTIPDSVQSIGFSAFYYCTNLTSIVIPNSVQSIDYWAFRKCSNLTSVYYTGTIDNWAEISFDNSGANPLYYADNLYINDTLVTEINLTTATKISAYAFYGYTKLTSVEIGDSVQSIGDYAFYDCDDLTSVVIGDSVQSIGYCAFSNCSNLNMVIIGDNVQSIGDYAFYDCSSLRNVCYKGTASEWAEISIGSYNTSLTNATIYYYIENEADLPNDGGNYWHYVDGEPKPW